MECKLQLGPRVTAFPFQTAPVFSHYCLNASKGDLLVAGKAERAGAGLTVGGGAAAGVAIITR